MCLCGQLVESRSIFLVPKAKKETCLEQEAEHTQAQQHAPGLDHHTLTTDSICMAVATAVVTKTAYSQNNFKKLGEMSTHFKPVVVLCEAYV